MKKIKLHPVKKERVIIFATALVILAAAIFVGYKFFLFKEDVGLLLTGKAMGSSYKITIVDEIAVEPDTIQEQVEHKLAEINAAISIYDATSEVSKINQAPANDWLEVSPIFAEILNFAIDFNRLTGGAHDITVGPLVNLWGFGPIKKETVPSDEEIEKVRQSVGATEILVEGNKILKKKEGMFLDFSSPGEGFAVDQLARLLKENGIKNFLVELGGEIVASGHKLAGQNWSVGIETPIESQKDNEALTGVVRISNLAVATSGSYHQYRKTGKVKSHHIIDPRTGRSPQSNLVSVTVIAESCMLAGSTGTALMVLGEEEGKKWLAQQKNIEAYFISVTGDNRFVVTMTPGFAAYLESAKR